MARMYSRKHGKSGSTKPSRKTPPSWLRYDDEEEVEKLVIKLAKEGKSSAEIGMELRDQYGIPSVKEITGKKVTEIMEENGLAPDIPEDLYNLLEQAARIIDHLEDHDHDPSAIRGLELTESKIRRLGNYYVEQGRLPDDWEYSRDRVKLMVK